MNGLEEKLRAMGCRVQAWRDGRAEGAKDAPPERPEPSGDAFRDMARLVEYTRKLVIPPPCDCIMCRAVREDPSVIVIVMSERGPVRTTLREFASGTVAGDDGHLYLMDIPEPVEIKQPLDVHRLGWAEDPS